jgi:hypothetical protein
MAGGHYRWGDDPLKADPAPEAVIGYAIRFGITGLQARWHWWGKDEHGRYTNRTCCGLAAGGGEVASLLHLLQGPACAECRRDLQRFIFAVALARGTKLPEEFSRGHFNAQKN